MAPIGSDAYDWALSFDVHNKADEDLKNCFRDECGSAHRGRCASLDPVDGIKLLEYLRHVNFTGQTLYCNCFIEQIQECYGRHYKLFYTNVFKIDIIYIIFFFGTSNMIFFSKLAIMLN